MFVIPTGTFTLGLQGRRHVAVPHRRDDDVRPADADDPAARARRLGTVVQRREPPHVLRPRAAVDHGEREQYAFRYLGALAADFHRILANGGMFLYPAIVNHPDPKKNRPQGKLRLMYEAAVVAFMCREAGGMAVDESGTPDPRHPAGKPSPADRRCTSARGGWWKTSPKVLKP